jgi:hypothetical protein
LLDNDKISELGRGSAFGTTSQRKKSSLNICQELRQPDSLSGREQIFISVLYVKKGQQSKEGMLCNSRGSKSFRLFLKTLGWDVDLYEHKGYAAGLDTAGYSNGRMYPYYASYTSEVMFHVAPRLAVAAVASSVTSVEVVAGEKGKNKSAIVSVSNIAT